MVKVTLNFSDTFINKEMLLNFFFSVFFFVTLFYSFHACFSNFLKRFQIIEKLEKDLAQDRKDKQIPAIASALMYSEFYKSKIQSQNSVNQNWKNKMDGV